MENCNDCDLKSQEINRLRRVCRTKDEAINKAIIKIIALGSLLNYQVFHLKRK